MTDKTIDVFPAVVTDQNTNAVLANSRARLVGGWLKVWCENPQWPHDPILAVNAQIDTPVIANTIGNTSIVPRKQQLVVMTIDRMVYKVNRASGCGCGSRLKAARNLPGANDNTAVAAWPLGNPAQPIGAGKQLNDIDAILSQHFPSLAGSHG